MESKRQISGVGSLARSQGLKVQSEFTIQFPQTIVGKRLFYKRPVVALILSRFEESKRKMAGIKVNQTKSKLKNSFREPKGGFLRFFAVFCDFLRQEPCGTRRVRERVGVGVRGKIIG